MKITEYIENTYFLNEKNHIQSSKNMPIIHYICKDNNYTILNYSEEFLEYDNIIDLFNNLKDVIVLILNPDIDFPPPKKPYVYDAYFNKYTLPSNHSEIDYYEKITTELIPIIEKNNIYVISYAASINHKNILFLPLGNFVKFHHFHFKKNKKENLCYLNIGIPCDRWFGNPRKKILELLQNKLFILKRSGLDMDSFYNDISRSKFMICPRGCGIDTYRLWDCISLGCIPIVEKYNSHEQWIDLPILFLDKIEDYAELSEEFLNKKYEEFLNKDFNYDKCKFEYWADKIISAKDILL